MSKQHTQSPNNPTVKIMKKVDLENQLNNVPLRDHMCMFDTKMEFMIDFCAEFLKHGSDWPVRVNTSKHQEYLLQTYTIFFKPNQIKQIDQYDEID